MEVGLRWAVKVEYRKLRLSRFVEVGGCLWNCKLVDRDGVRLLYRRRRRRFSRVIWGSRRKAQVE
jgi:hypothetical protein